MNWIVVLTRNNLELTKKAINSFRCQDIGNISILVIDNESKNDNTIHWLKGQSDLHVVHNRPAKSVAASWNAALRWLFSARWADANTPLEPRAEWVLVANNDVVLRKDTYRWLVKDGGEFVTAVGTRDEKKIVELVEPDASKKRPHPDFSCYLIRRSVWEKVGEFDENFKTAFFEDNCYHLRMHRAGIKAQCLELPFLHYGSMTIKNAGLEEQKRISQAAANNKEYFFRKYGVYAGTPEYYELFGHPAPQEQEG